MALSFNDSVNKMTVKAKAAPMNAIQPMMASEPIAAYAVTEPESEFMRSEKYLWYEEYIDESYSTVEADKSIKFDTSQINLTQEENSQYIPFQMDRYWDGIDIATKSLQIYFVNSQNYDYIATPVNVRYSSSKIRFGWLVDGHATAIAGKLRLEIRAIGLNEKNDPYCWISKSTDDINILASLKGNGIIEPDNDWMTQFIREMDGKLVQAAGYITEAQNIIEGCEQYVEDAQLAAIQAQGVIDNAKTELAATIEDEITGKLLNYYTKPEVDTLLDNLDMSGFMQEVDNKIAAIDGLENFRVVDTITENYITIQFYNGEILLKTISFNRNPSLEWTNAFAAAIAERYMGAIAALRTEISEGYYDNTEVDALLADKASSTEVSAVANKITAVEQTANTNKTGITAIGTKVAALEDAIANVDKSAQKTYDATYDSEQLYTLWEIENEGLDNETRTAKSQFKILGGGGGPSTSSILKIEYVTTSPLIVTTDDKALITYKFSGTDSSGDIVPEAKFTWKIGNSIIATGITVNGNNTFDATDYISIGSQKLTLTITDDAGSLVTKSWTVQKIDIRLESGFNDQIPYPINTVSFDYTPYGAVAKDIHFILDGVELPKVTTTASGIPMAYTLPTQAHGSHLLETYITAVINNATVESNHIFKDIIWYSETSSVPIIGCTQTDLTVQQYDNTNITYVVFDPKTETPFVTLKVDGIVVSTLALDSHVQTWQYRSDTIGAHTLTITCGETVKTIHVNVEKLDIDVEPVTANLVFDFNPSGKSNNDTDRLWSSGDIAMTVSDNFDWVNGGYHLDENGDQYFCVKAGTSAEINYNLFADEARKNGKEFKLVFKTMNVRKADTTFLSCQSGDTTKIGLEMNVHNAYIKSSAKSLFAPYSEEDIIEFEFNINKDTDIPIVMTYEDGTPYRPMSYNSDCSFTQSTPVPISIGSPDCDVLLYRMKVYNASLSSRAILSNFIADARNATEMIARYNRNQIYDENSQLTPDSVAKARPDLKIIKLECPHFTNDKKDFVKGTSAECIHIGGDPVLDNWKAINCYHSGQGTTSNEYGAAGRNMDILMCFDGEYQNSKITYDPNYKTVLTFGDGTVYNDGTGKITLTRNSVPTNYLNIKVNIASSENANNALLQRRFDTYLPYENPAKVNDPKIKNDMEFVNCVVFVKESDPDLSTHREFQDTEWHFYAIGNIGDSKKTDYSRVVDVNDPKECVVEIMDNTLPNSTFSGTPEALAALDADQFDEDGTYGWRYEMSGITAEQEQANMATWREFYRFVATSTDEDFKAHLGDWMILDSVLYMYLFTERYTMIDNRAKNTFYHYVKCSDGKYRYEYWDYDNDKVVSL